MKTNFKFNQTSLRSVEAKARMAAAAASAAMAVRKELGSATQYRDNQEYSPHDNRISKEKKTRLPEIERDIQSIFKALNSRITDGMKTVMEKSSKTGYCKATIRILKESNDSTPDSSPDKRNVLVIRYSFYASTLDPTKLGSVAIYCDDAASLLASIQASGSLFGHRFISATLEIGRRPFIDVKIRN